MILFEKRGNFVENGEVINYRVIGHYFDYTVILYSCEGDRS